MKVNKNKVRIVAGKWRGRFITFPNLPNLRPTPNRARETLFNWLGSSVVGMTCLDLFAGSGALGFEASSRGADRVVLVDSNKLVSNFLQDNNRKLSGNGIEIHRLDALDFCNSDTRTYDLVFLDPPFELNFHDKLLQKLQRLIRPGSLVYVESNRPLELSASYRSQRQSKAGKVIYILLEYKP